MDDIADLFYFAGTLVCHQISERTLFVNGMQLPVCARDMGIYLGIFVSLMFCVLGKKMSSDRLPELKAGIILALMMIPMMADGLSSYLGLRSTNNVIRLLTGAFFGIPIPVFLIPCVNYKINGNNLRAVIKGFNELFRLYLICGLVVLATLIGVIPWIILSSVFVFSLIFIISRTVYTVFKVTGTVLFKSAFWTVTVTTVLVFGLMFFVSRHLANSVSMLF